ncbi:hypothetical protein [uncultured Gammaproteobacteria bacterium]|jgi:hypothetical protein|nr:hypothetical protein [uncultured Gammaproteobacteria bacterium]
MKAWISPTANSAANKPIHASNEKYTTPCEEPPTFNNKPLKKMDVLTLVPIERIKCPAIILIINRNPRVSGRELIVTISTKKRKGTKNIGANLGTRLVKF